MTLLTETKTTPGNSIASQRETQLNSANSCPGRSAQVNSNLPPSCGRENSRVYRDSATFLEKCTSKRKLRISPLTGNFHLCRVEESKSSRKPSLRTQRSTGSTASGETYSRSPLFNEDVFSFDSNGHGNSPTRLTREISVEKEKRLSSPGGKMGCRLSSVERLKDANGSSNDEDVDPPADNDVGMTSVSKADLLDAQRLNSTDVTRGLENRWIRSHFQEQSKNTNSDATRAKRRKSKVCVSDPDETDTTAVLSEVRNHLSILHFNDVYEITQRKKEPVGGAARFATLIKRLVEETTRKTGEKPLVVFSGDCLNPSTLSCATQGRHMIEILDTLGVDVAVFGNHEFDFGVEHAATCVSKMSSKWLLGNVIDKLTQRNLGDGLSKLIIERKNGIKIGLLGLVEEEWLDTLATVNKSDLDFQDYVDRGRELAAELRADGADFVIALTHMRWPNDIRLARLVPDIDLILGGHDHEYAVKEVDECLVIKSGSDFRNFSSLDVFLRDDGCVDVKISRYDVTMDIAEDPVMTNLVNRYTSVLEKSLEKCIGVMHTKLDGRFKMVRSRETELGNFVADIMASVTRADVVLINSGTFRSDGVHTSGDFRLHDLMTILPINDCVVSIVVTGAQLLEALENGVGVVPKYEGRFPQVSGVTFGFNPGAKPGCRVIQETVRVQGKPLDLERRYTMATKAYVARGKDGYSGLSKCQILTDPDSGPLLSTVVRNHIMNVSKLLEFEKNRNCKISISKDGRKVVCDDATLDPSHAFNETDIEEFEEPISAIQRDMKPVIDGNNNPGYAGNSPVSTLHLPTFISMGAVTDSDDVAGQKIEALRKKALSGNTGNNKLLAERTADPTQLRWQVLPLLEARIFHCESFAA